MLKHLFLILLLLSGCNIFAQSTATVTFITDTKTKVQICKPIEGQYINKIVDKELALCPDTPIVYTVSVDRFIVLDLKFDGGKWRFAYLTPGDSLIIKNINSKLTYEGGNALENSIFNNEYIEGIKSFTLLLLNDSINYKNISSYMNNYVSELNNSVDNKENEFSPLFRKVIKNSFLNTTQFFSIVIYKAILQTDKNITDQDSTVIYSKIDSIFKDIDIHDQELIKTYPRSSGNLLSLYLQNKYDHLGESQKIKLFENSTIGKDVYGKYDYLILASDSLERSELGSLIYSQYKFYKNEINKDKLYAYYKSKYPDSEYIELIDNLIVELETKEIERVKNENIHFIEDSIPTLKDLASHPLLKGKFIFIDVWATWCAPCISEFKHTKKLHDLLADYDNTAIVYISTDATESKEYWKTKTNDYNLEGYSLMAQDSLREDIEDKAFNGSGLTIPRYILIDPNGNIINAMLPRPSNYDKLKEELDKLLKSK